jgi:hypothetical protein
MAEPILISPIPLQVVNELASYGPFDLKKHIQDPDGGKLGFVGEIKGGAALPKGMILTSDGILTGIPAKETQGVHEIQVTAINEEGDSLAAFFTLTIKPALAQTEVGYMEKLKAQIWEAMEKNLPIPELRDLVNLPINQMDIYYLLERWGTLTIWNAFNLDPPSEKKILTLPGASKHYDVYDRGSSIIMCPKDLFSHERTVADGMQTAKAMAREVYNRDWTIEMAGLSKWTRNVWVELQILGDQHGKYIDIINYTPSKEDENIYTVQSTVPRSGMD